MPPPPPLNKTLDTPTPLASSRKRPLPLRASSSNIDNAADAPQSHPFSQSSSSSASASASSLYAALIRSKNVFISNLVRWQYNQGPTVQHDEQDHLANLLAVWNGDQLNGLAHTFADVVDLDIYLLLGYKLAQANRGHIVLPHGVGLEIWDEDENDDNHADWMAKRQYLVLRDKLIEYDLFVSSYLPVSSPSIGKGAMNIIGPRQLWVFINAMTSHGGVEMTKANVRNGSSTSLHVVYSTGSRFDVMVLTSDMKQPNSNGLGWIATQAGVLKLLRADCFGEIMSASRALVMKKTVETKESAGCQNITVMANF